MNSIMTTSIGRRAGRWFKTKYTGRGLLLLALTLSLPISTPAHADVPSSLSYQAYLTDGTGAPIDGDLAITFSMYTGANGGGPHWWETQTVTVSHGLFSVELGASPINPLPLTAFNIPQWLGVTVENNDEMTPRRFLTSAAFALKTADTDRLQGLSGWALDQSAHEADFANPHGVTAGQAGAVFSGGISSHESDSSRHHVKLSDFGGLSGPATDAQIPATIARDTELTWNSMAGSIPPDFADGEDNIGIGDITGVSTTAGLAGGGSSGGVTVALDTPLAVPGDLLLDSGNLGIGLSNPNRRLYVVNDTSGMDYALKLDNPHAGIGTTGVGMLFSTEGDAGVFAPARGKGALAYTSTDTWNRGAFHLLQDTGENTAIPDLDDAVMTIANNGNVGIGTITPATKLDVRGPCLTIVCDPSPAYVSVDGGVFGLSGYRFNEAGERRWLLFFRQWQSDNLIVRDETGPGRDTMTFQSGTGRVGIGTNTPQARLDVAGDVKFRNDLNLTGYIRTTAYSRISMADFIPTDESQEYYFDYGQIQNTSQTNSFTAYAPVILPDGTTVVSVSSSWRDWDPENGYVVLRRYDLNDFYSDEMSRMDTYWNTEYSDPRTIIDNEVEVPVIDNYRYAYVLKLVIPPIWLDPFPPGNEQVLFENVLIEYLKPIS